MNSCITARRAFSAGVNVAASASLTGPMGMKPIVAALRWMPMIFSGAMRPISGPMMAPASPPCTANFA